MEVEAMRIGLAMSGAGPLATLLERFATNAAALEETAFPAIVEDFRRMNRRRWDADGPDWERLSPATVDIKARRGEPDPSRILYGTGALRESLISETHGSVVEIRPGYLFMGTDIPYAQYHQQGPRQIRVFGKSAAKLPERPVVEVKPEDAARWCLLIRNALLKRR